MWREWELVFLFKKKGICDQEHCPPLKKNPVLTCNIGLSMKGQKIKSCAKMQWLGKYL